MIGRVCEKHGEYAPDGICRWCEPADPRKVTAEELAEMFGAMTQAVSPMCVCRKCLRGFMASIPLTSLECPACRPP